MAYSISKLSVINYPPTAIKEFWVYGVEWIDNLHFLHPPKEFFLSPSEQLSPYLEIVRSRFLEAGWEGDGDITLLWLPAFIFPLSLAIPWEGIILWHVKQEEDGISWLLSPIQLPFEEFQERSTDNEPL